MLLTEFTVAEQIDLLICEQTAQEYADNETIFKNGRGLSYPDGKKLVKAWKKYGYNLPKVHPLYCARIVQKYRKQLLKLVE